MINGQSTKKMVRKAAGSRDRPRTFRIPHQARRMLYYASLARSRHHCYSCNSGSCCLPHLEAHARLRMVNKEGNHG